MQKYKKTEKHKNIIYIFLRQTLKLFKRSTERFSLLQRYRYIDKPQLAGAIGILLNVGAHRAVF